jgi:hypothetical protein
MFGIGGGFGTFGGAGTAGGFGMAGGGGTAGGTTVTGGGETAGGETAGGDGITVAVGLMVTVALSVGVVVVVVVVDSSPSPSPPPQPAANGLMLIAATAATTGGQDLRLITSASLHREPVGVPASPSDYPRERVANRKAFAGRL